MRLSLDSNILIYAAHNDDRRHVVARALVERAAKADCIQTLQSLGECFRVLTNKRGFSPEDARLAVNYFRALFRVVAADEPAFDHAIEIVRAHRLSFWDAMLWSTARRAGCRLLLSENMHDSVNLGGMRVLNPFNPENCDLIDLALPPLEA